MAEPFIMGLNYWPQHKGPYWWSNFDVEEVRREFGHIAEMGLNMIRFFLTWDDFQPQPDMVDGKCLENLVTVCDIGAEFGLQLDPTFFCGFMSGTSWSPRWLLIDGPPTPPHRQVVSEGRLVQRGYRNHYTDPVALDASRLLIREVVTALKGHSAVTLWDLGNEPDGFVSPPDVMTANTWIREMAGIIREIDPDTPITYGMHMANLDRNNELRLHDVFDILDVAVMHPYPIFCDWARGPLDTDVAPYSAALTSALCGKPVLLQEFGGCTAPPGQDSFVMEWDTAGGKRSIFMASEEAFANYIAEVLPKLVEVGCTGAMIWSYGDYAPELWDKPPCHHSPHERSFGLVRVDGTLKPHARVFQGFAAARPTVKPATGTLQLDITPDEYYQDARHHLARLYKQYLAT